MQAKRPLEAFDDVLKCREQVKNHVALTRAKETEQERANHRKSAKEHKAASNLRAKESEKEKASCRKGMQWALHAWCMM